MASLVRVFATVAVLMSLGLLSAQDGDTGEEPSEASEKKSDTGGEPSESSDKESESSDEESESSDEEIESSEEESSEEEEEPKNFTFKNPCPPLKAKMPLRAMLPGGGVSEFVYEKKPYEYCNCTSHNQTYGNWTAKEDEDCLVTAAGYDGELTQKEGTCKGGICEYTIIRRGCRKDDLKKEPEKGVLPLGCAFTCTGDDKKKEYGFYKVNTTCQHYEKGKYINTTCKSTSAGMRCWESIPAGMAC